MIAEQANRVDADTASRELTRMTPEDWYAMSNEDQTLYVNLEVELASKSEENSALEKWEQKQRPSGGDPRRRKKAKKQAQEQVEEVTAVEA